MADQKNTQRDKEERPTPPVEPAEGDEETIDESLRQKEKKDRPN
ncbi:MAG: hypothetical protein SFV54_23935 [Bryobacteraceae bacterium]|nr:hypothetical protein [Bryobacteraceae bacterium]